MANILDQLLTVLGFKSSGSAEPSVATHTDGRTGVERYVVQQSTKGKKPAPAKKAKAKRAAPAKKRASPAKKAKAAPKKASSAGSTARCQAGTSSGSQCKRTNKLKTVQRTINNKKYRLTVCNQHDNDSLKPYTGFKD